MGQVLTETKMVSWRAWSSFNQQTEEVTGADVADFLSTIDHWRQRAEQAHNQGQNAAIKEVAGWIGSEAATFHALKKAIDDQLTTLIREVAMWRLFLQDSPVAEGSKTIQDAIAVTNAHPDLQARIAREMESE
jgi:hypothetical protein